MIPSSCRNINNWIEMYSAKTKQSRLGLHMVVITVI